MAIKIHGSKGKPGQAFEGLQVSMKHNIHYQTGSIPSIGPKSILEAGMVHQRG